MSSAIAAPPTDHSGDERAQIHQHWWLFLLLGVVSIIVGMLAISSTLVATMASILFFGWLLLIEGVFELVHSFMVRNWKGFGLHLVSAVLYLLAGLFMLKRPLESAVIFTALIGAAFIAGGIMRMAFAVGTRFHGWGWVMLNGLVDLVLGLMIFNNWPESSLWVIGLFVGIDILIHGWSCLFLAMSLRAFRAAQAK